MLIPAHERRRVTARLYRGEKVELDWGLVITPPTNPSGIGGGGNYRWSFYDPPIRDDGTRGRRRHRTAAELDERTWARIEEDLDALEATVVGQPETRLDASFAELAEHWLDPTRHPDWSEGYAAKVTSTTRNWLLADRVTVEVGRNGRARAVPLAAIRLEDLTCAMAMEALAHVRRARAHGTYRSVHECLTGILNWGVSVRWMPVGHLETRAIRRAPDPRVGARRVGARGNLQAVPKEDIPDLDEVLLPFHRWVEQHQGRDARVLLDVLAFSGPRIGEALALHRDRMSRDEAGNGWASIEQRARRQTKGQAPPKHRKHRDMWIPAWLADDLETVTPNEDGYLFGAPRGSTWPVARWGKRRFDRWAESFGWEELDDYCPHRGHDEAGCAGQNRRRWRFTPHDWRHAAAVWQLFELRLDPEDVARHLGHRDGYTLYQLYVGARPGRARRAAVAAAETGDPRQGQG